MNAIGHQGLHVHLFIAGGDDLDGQSIFTENALFRAEVNRQGPGQRAGCSDAKKRLRNPGARAEKQYKNNDSENPTPMLHN